jgi:hypothetical protein
MGFRRYEALLRESTAYLHRLLPPGPSVYAAGSNGALVGRRVDALPAAGPVPADFELDSPSGFTDVDPSAPTVPALITGTVDEAYAGAQIAVAVNGRVAGTTTAFTDNASAGFGGIPTRFLSVVPPRAFKHGRNVVRVFRIEGSGARIRLAAFGGSGEVTLAGTRLKLTDGRTIELSKRVSGFVEGNAAENDRLIVAGWAIDAERERPAQRVFVFADGRLLGSGTTGVVRRDVAKAQGRGALRSGFRLQLPTTEATALAEAGQLTVVALSGDAASRLAALND